MKWSILILTIPSRQHKLQSLLNELDKQITNSNLKDIEVLVNGEDGSIGKKRNDLLKKAKGDYVCFIDDDDRISPDYIVKIYRGLLDEPDCISLIGIMTVNGKGQKRFIHSLKYNSYFEKAGTYYRPPNHLNTIKRELALKVKYPDINFGEDTDWAMKLSQSGLLKKEYKINTVLYYYRFQNK